MASHPADTVHFRFAQKVLFKHCDPAGIVFYPRFVEMINDAVEALFDQMLDWPFEHMHPGAGVPTAALDIQFKAPCRHGDLLDLKLTVMAFGRTSMSLKTHAVCDDETRFVANQTLVCVNSEARPNPWPEHVRQHIAKMMKEGVS